MLSYGCTRLEIGVQSVYEDVARDTNRSDRMILYSSLQEGVLKRMHYHENVCFVIGVFFASLRCSCSFFFFVQFIDLQAQYSNSKHAKTGTSHSIEESWLGTAE